MKKMLVTFLAALVLSGTHATAEEETPCLERMRPAQHRPS